MVILLKGPYSRKDYIDIQDNLEEQIETLCERIERIKNNVIIIALIVGILYYIGIVVCTFDNRHEYEGAILSFMVGGSMLIVIITLIAYHFSAKPYNKQIKDLSNEAEQLEKHYQDNMVEVPLSEYIDRISVKGDKVTFPPLDEVDERYLYDTWSYNLADEDHSTRQIMRIYENFYERDFLNTYYNREIPITREECLILQAKGRRW